MEAKVEEREGMMEKSSLTDSGRKKDRRRADKIGEHPVKKNFESRGE